MIIDSLTHILPTEVSSNIEKYKKIDQLFDSLFDEKTKIIETEDLIKNMKSNNIDKSVVAGFGWNDYGLASLVNEYIYDASNKYQEKIIPLCSLDINSKFSEQELLKCISKGVKGIGELHIDYDNKLEKNTIFKNILNIASENNLPILIHGSEPVGHLYNGKGNNHPKKLYELVKNNPSNKFIFSHFGGGLVFYEQMPEVKKALRNVYYDSSAQPYLYNKNIYRNAINSSSIEKILFASDYPLINIKRCLSETDYLDNEEKSHIFSHNSISAYNL
ncbi:MAG: metal-dependent hydrolase [Chloroflexi bacterium]|nr:metal-dependent hydrolase [Chloroflexota bacterium]|tara:strand:- start:14388 stop:15212 length:825 start_codon:yes stop_codon:yes gene_type:complete